MNNDPLTQVLDGIHEGAWESKARSLTRFPNVDEAIINDCAARFNQPSELPAIIETLSNHKNVSTSPDALNMLAMAAFKLSEIENRKGEDGTPESDKADAWFAAAVSVGDFKQARRLCNWAKLLLNQQRYEKSEQLLLRAKSICPKSAQPWINLLELYTATGREADRRATLKEMHEKWPEHVDDPDIQERFQNDPTILATP